jgi:hypothetical protein
MEPQRRTVDHEIARLASRSHGVVTHSELLGAGITRQEIKIRRGRGSLVDLYRGVYRVGHAAPSTEADYLAAVRACGSGAVLSGRAAGYLLGLLRGHPPRPEVTAPAERRIPGLRTHRARRLDPSETTVWRGVPATSVARTLVDLAGALGADALARACHEAAVLHRTMPADVDAVLARRPNARGAAKLRAVLNGDVQVTLSALERRFLALLRDERLPRPVTNLPAGSHRVDCRWPEPGVTVELDSYRYHSSRHAWERDRRREREAHARGDEFRRYTYGDVFEDPSLMLAELRTLLRTPLV